MAPNKARRAYVPPHLRQQSLNLSNTPLQSGSTGMLNHTNDNDQVPGTIKVGSETLETETTPHPGSSAHKATPDTSFDSATIDWDLALPNLVTRTSPAVSMPRHPLPRNSSMPISNPATHPVQPGIRTTKETSVATQRSSAPVSTNFEASKIVESPPESKQHPQPKAQQTNNRRSTRNQKKNNRSTWIKDRDIRNLRNQSPNNNAWGSIEEDKGKEDVDSVIADNGFGPGRRGADDYGGYQLRDWDGSWAPAPVDWEERGDFKDQKWGEHLDQWLNESATISQDKVDLVLENACGRNAGDLAPKPWIPKSIDNIPIHAWWAQHLKSPLYDGPPNAKPWWEYYLSEKSQMLSAIAIPPTKAPNPAEESRVMRNKRLQDLGSAASSQGRIDTMAKRKETKKYFRDRDRRDNNVARKEVEERINNPRSFYVRAANENDISAMTEIYNEHVQNTHHCLEPRPVCREDMAKKYSTMATMMYPIMVAVEYSKGKDGKPRYNPSPAPDDLVIGFAHANGFDTGLVCEIDKGGGGIVRQTVTLEIYVDPDHRKKQVGDTLMDRMSITLSTCLAPSRIYHHYWKSGSTFDYGPAGPCASVIVQIPFPAGSDEHLGWMSKWLAKWDFEQVGILREIGVKSENKMNLALFQRLTHENIR